ncbi:flagellar export chaperone FliS [Bacillus piscicola]|uniref:flagellar export chaperone FliS n=1 Tax=Bacillus piscicola TaxID=1632684 RepID=UPI001F09785E|nr:flagellar export chaperone FliS [Bacillus piscicola]
MAFLSEEMLQKKSSQELTMLLYEACERNIEEAISFIKKRDYISANQKLQRAIDILERLGVGLNYEAGIIADELDSLYNYMSEQLMAANVKKDRNAAENVLVILRKLSRSWIEAMRTQTDKQSQVSRRRTNAYEQNVLYEK